MYRDFISNPKVFSLPLKKCIVFLTVQTIEKLPKNLTTTLNCERSELYIHALSEDRYFNFCNQNQYECIFVTFSTWFLFGLKGKKAP